MRLASAMIPSSRSDPPPTPSPTLPYRPSTIPGVEESYYVPYEEDTEMDPEVPDIEGATYLGCFEDMRGERTMKIAYINDDDMTNEVSKNMEDDHRPPLCFPSKDRFLSPA